MSTPTVNYGFELPEVGADSNIWGGYLNGNWTSLDGLLKTAFVEGTLQADALDDSADVILKMDGTTGPFGLGKGVTSPSNDWNDVDLNGFYVMAQGLSNAPPEDVNGTWTVVVTGNKTYVTQTASYGEGVDQRGPVYTRTKASFAWSAWARVWVEGDIISAPAFIGKSNIKYWGAVGDGVTPDDTAINDCVDWTLANDRPMEVPAGKFVLDALVTRSVTGPAVKWGIVGDGQGTSEFIIPATNTTGGFDIDVSGTGDRSDQARFENFSIFTLGSGGTGLGFVQEPGGAQDLNTIIADNVRIWTNTDWEANGYGYFDDAFLFAGAWRPLIDGCYWGGPILGFNTSLDPDTHPALKTARALNLNDSYDAIVTSSWFKGAQIAINTRSSITGEESEAFRMSKCVMNQCNYGVFWQRNSREPLLMIDKCHVNYRTAGFILDGSKLAQLTHNQMFNEDVSSLFAGTPKDFSLLNTQAVTATGNIFHFDGHPQREGIFVNGSAASEVNSGKYNIISNNNFTGTFNIGIDLTSGTSDNIGSMNQFAGGTVTTPVLDNGTNNNVT